MINGSNDDNDLKGTSGIDTITGGRGNDSLNGKQGGDVIGGGKGDDSLQGNQGGDRLNGGAGENTLKGGRGYDVFVIKNKKGNTTISDLNIEQDTIEVSNNRYTITAQGDDSVLTFKNGATSVCIHGL